MTDIVESDSVIIIFDTEQGPAGPPGPAANTNATYVLVQAASGLPNSAILQVGTGLLLQSASGILTISATGGGTGTVTSVGLNVPSDLFTPTGSPVTTAGIITLSKVNQTGNVVYASPANGTSGAPGWRNIAANDIAALFSAGSNISIVGGSTLTISATGLGTSSASGTVTSVAANNLNAFATVSVATPTITPVINFTLAQPGAGQFFGAPASGSGVPGYRNLILSDLPAGNYTVNSSNILNNLASGNGIGLLSQNGGTTAFRTLTGTVGRVTITNGDGSSGNPTFDVGVNVHTNSTSNILNALTSATSGSAGLLTQLSDTSFVDRTITGTAGRVVVTNGSGVGGNPTLDLGTNVYTTSTSGLLNKLASATPTNGQVPIGNGLDFTLATLTPGPGIQITNSAGVITLSSYASATLLSIGNLSTWFTTTNTNGDVTFTPTGAKGNIPYYSNTNTAANLSVGTASQVLGVSNGLPAYLNTLQGFASATVSSTLTNASLSYQVMDASTAPVTLTLPAASSCIGDVFYFKNITVTGSNACTIQTNGTDTIEGSLVAKTVVKLQVIGMISDGVNTWRYLKPQIESPQSGGTGSAVIPTDGQIPIGSTSGQVYTPATITQGTGITIVNGPGTITISSTATGGGSVSTVSDLAPLFTTANRTTTPTFSLTSQASGQVFCTPASGVNTAPTFQSLTPAYITNNYIEMGLLIDGASAVIPTGAEGQFRVPCPLTITGFTVLGQFATGSCTFNVYKCTYASYPTFTSVVGTGTKPSIASAFKSQNLAISDWTGGLNLNTGDILQFVLEANSSFQQLTISLTALRTG